MGNFRSQPEKLTIVEMLNRMEANLNTFDKRLEEHFAAGCPDGENLRQFYLDSLNNTRDSVQKCRKIIVDRLVDFCFP